MTTLALTVRTINRLWAQSVRRVSVVPTLIYNNGRAARSISGALYHVLESLGFISANLWGSLSALAIFFMPGANMITDFTKEPLGSSGPYVLFNNAQNFDTAVNSITEAIWQDSFGKNRHTWYGIESLAMQSMLNYGYITAKSFELGFTLNTHNTVLQWESNGEFYR